MLERSSWNEQDEQGVIVRTKDGEIKYPRLHKFTAKIPIIQISRVCANGSVSEGANDEFKQVILAKDVVFMRALKNTFVFVLVVAPLRAGLALMLALLINQKLRGINIYRAIYFMPVVVSIVVVAFLWRLIYDGNNGRE